MGRKAKDAATKKIGEWTSSRRKMSKTTTIKENTNTLNEIRTPIQTQTQIDLNAMKNCSVRLEKIQIDFKLTDNVNKTPVKKVPTTDAMTKDNQAKTQNVYDYSFDDGDDTPGPMKEIDGEMKDLFDKLAKENIIEVKKYRPKNGKKIKTDEKKPVKKAQKRRRDKQPIDIEPTQKKPNLKRNVANPNVLTKSKALPAVVSSKGTDFDLHGKVDSIKTVNAQPTLRNRNLQHAQSTLKTSTPLGTKLNAMRKPNNSSLNSIFFENASPLMGTLTRGNILKQRLQLSAIIDSRENVQNEKLGNNNDNEIVSQLNYNDDDNFDFGNNAANEPDPVQVDKENSLDRPTSSVHSRPPTTSATSSLWDQPSTSAAALRSLEKPGISHQPGTISAILRSTNPSDKNASTLRSLQKPEKSTTTLNADNNQPGTSSRISPLQDRPSTSSAILRSQDRPSTSSAASNGWDQPSTSTQSARTPLKNNNDNSVFEISSECNIFSPTKRRVYGRSPLKNITSEVNNTSSPSFESVKSTTSAPRSFGVLPKSTLNSIQSNNNSTKENGVTLPEASYFSTRRAAEVFDRKVDNPNCTDNCFGFDDNDDDEEITNENTNKGSESTETTTTTSSMIEARKSALEEVRTKLKRFLHNPDGNNDESIKKSKITSKHTTNNKIKPKQGLTVKSPTKAVKSPAKQKQNVVFGDTGAKQKDIRNAFTFKPSDICKKNNPNNNPVNLFEEVETVQDRRRSYSRPQRVRKRRVSIESEDSEEDDDEDFDENGKPSKRAKRRKKTTEPNPKELEELEEFARQTNQHFDEVDSFELVVE